MEGYADYAVIPEKTNSNDLKENENKKNQSLTYRRHSHPNFRRSNSHQEATSSGHTTSLTGKSQTQSKYKENFVSKTHSSKGKDLNAKPMESYENSERRKKSLDACGIHSKISVEMKDNPDTHENQSKALKSEKFYTHQDELSSTEKINFDKQKSESSEKNYNSNDCPEQNTSVSNPISMVKDNVLQNSNSKFDHIELKPNSCSSENKVTNEHTDTEIQKISSTLPDILSTVNKSGNVGKTSGVDGMTKHYNVDKGMSSTAKSFLSQACSFSNTLNSEAHNKESESEYSQFSNLHSIPANQSIYKLAFDESIDQYETLSRSPSPTDTENQIPRSLTNDEILIHEADTASEAGSEDVELLPHRYESETFLNEKKHMYVNKLSLAVELLRTQESLPYDKEFKRVVPDNSNIVPVHKNSQKNARSNDTNILDTTNKVKGNERGDLNSTETHHSAHSSNDSAIFSDVDFESLEIDELCESAKEVTEQSGENQESQRIRTGFRRLGTQARYFSPRTALSFNPCLCCAIM